MSRNRWMLTVGLAAAATIGLFACFVGLRRDQTLINSLTAAGTVVAAGFAAVAALASMRSAAESGAAARRSRMAAAQSARPHVVPVVEQPADRVLGVVRCPDPRGAVDLTVVWSVDGRQLVDTRSHMHAGEELVVDLDLRDVDEAWTKITMVWISYLDAGRVGHWHDTWRPAGTTGAGSGLALSDSRLLD